MISPKESTTVVRQVVRGERPWHALRDLGMSVDPDAGQTADIPPLEVRITAEDLALGFVAHLDNPEELRRWAFVMQAAPCDFSTVAARPEGEWLLDALW